LLIEELSFLGFSDELQVVIAVTLSHPFMNFNLCVFRRIVANYMEEHSLLRGLALHTNPRKNQMRMFLAHAATAMLLTASHAQQQPANPNANTPAVNT
jgi:hypothetical protein